MDKHLQAINSPPFFLEGFCSSDIQGVRYKHENLIAYQKGIILVENIFQLTSSSKPHTSLKNQICRSSVSFVSNIVEGVSRTSIKEKKRFLEIAYGSLLELDCQLVILVKVDSFGHEEIEELRNQIEELVKITSGLRRSFN